MIPKVIHYFWIGDNPLPELAVKCIESWKKFCPEYEIIEWNEKNYDFSKNQYMYEAYKEKQWGFVPDYARLDIMYNYGGIYLDTDVEIIKPLDNLLSEEAFMGMEQPGIVALGLGFGSEPHNSVIKEMMEYYEGRSFYNTNGSFDTAASPGIQTQTLKKYGLKELDEIQTIKNVTVFPCEYFCPDNPYTGKLNVTSNTFSIHHYMGSWMTLLDKIIFGINRRFDKRKKAQYYCERILSLPFRIARKIKRKGISGAIKTCKEKIRKLFKRANT